MTDDTERRNRRSIRLKEYDYAHPGAYFVTVCTRDRECWFGDIAGGQMILNDVGRMVQIVWDEIRTHFNRVELDQSIIMPNHIHGIIIITDEGGGAGGCKGLINQTPTTQPSTADWILMKNDALVLGKVIRYFKAKTTKIIHYEGITTFHWQRNYYEYVIRSENELGKIREYIVNNPTMWDTDEENPNAQPPHPSQGQAPVPDLVNK